MAITETIVAPIWPQTADGKTVFNQKSDALAPQLIDIQNQMNTYATQANALATEVNGYQVTASAAAVAAANAQTASEGFSDEAEGFKDDSQAILDSNTIIAAAVQSAAGLPSLTGNAGLALVVNETEDGVLWGSSGGERLSFTKSFSVGEERTYALDGEASIPVVSVTKEVPQIGVTNNKWDVDAGEYEQGGSDLVIGNIISIEGDALISNSSYDSVSFSVGSQDAIPIGLAFSPDGTKMFIVGNANATVYQYTLTTGFDVSTASYDNLSFSVSSQEATPYGLAFSTDGTKMFVLGNTNRTVFQYTLTTGFDVSTASYDSVSFSVSSQEGNTRSLAFSPDGTKMFVLGTTNDTVYQYTLTTGFDVSTASYDNLSFSVSSQEATPYGLAFSTDGTKMFVLGNTNRTVFQYTLTTGFDVSTASYDSVSFSVSSQDTSPRGLAFSTDGTKMFIVGNANDTVYQYTTGFNYTDNQHIPAITDSDGQINTTFWTDINSMTANETLNGQTINYALSNDDRGSWQIGLTGDSPRNIVRNNGGTWEYNSDATYAGETWTAASANTEFDALSEAMSVAANQMNSTQLQALTDAEQIALGNELDLAVILFTDDSTVTPSFSGMTIDYDANIKNQAAILGTDYEWWSYEDTDITIKALSDNNLKGRVL